LAREANSQLSTAARALKPASRETYKFHGRRSTSWKCPSPRTFSLLVVYAGNDIALHLAGDLNAPGVRALNDCAVAVLSEWPRRLILDCTGLVATDPDGVACIRSIRDRATAAQIELVLVSVAEPVLAQLTHDGELFSVRI
jgi:ABC-type transporter Mla MlaB component